MNIIVKKNADEVSKEGANIFIEEINKKPNIVLCLATGSTPQGLYKELIKANKNNEVNFKRVKSFNLDNYIGLEKNDINNYDYYMREKLFNHINIDKENWLVPFVNEENYETYCKEYDQLLEESGIDLLLLGIGENGHIAFNEPSDKFSVGTHIVDLDEKTRKANSRFFDSIEDVPKQAITMGIGSIMKAKKIVLLAIGEKKKEVIKKLLSAEKIDPQFPASILLAHRDVTIITEEALYDKN